MARMRLDCFHSTCLETSPPAPAQVGMLTETCPFRCRDGRYGIFRPDSMASAQYVVITGMPQPAHGLVYGGWRGHSSFLCAGSRHWVSVGLVGWHEKDVCDSISIVPDEVPHGARNAAGTDQCWSAESV